MNEGVDHGRVCRRLMRRQSHAALATSLPGEPGARPYVSLVAVACDLDASPLLLLSDLAQHSRNIAAEPRVSLLFDGDARLAADPLAEPRLSLQGEAARSDDKRLLARFVARHPGAAAYAGFGDFHLYRATIGRGHLVAGFGRISWVEPQELRFADDVQVLAEAEDGILAHMNGDHADAVALYATRLLRRAGSGWRITGMDPEGIDLRGDTDTARLDFADHGLTPVLDAAGARQALVALVAAARRPRRVNICYAGLKVASRLACLVAEFWYLAPRVFYLAGAAASAPGDDGGKLGKDGQPGDGPEAVL